MWLNGPSRTADPDDDPVRTDARGRFRFAGLLPGRFVVRSEIALARPRELEVTYTKEFSDIVHDLRGHIGAIRHGPAVAQQGVAP